MGREKSGSMSSYGKYIDIKLSNGLITRYAHCSSIYVKKNAKVKAGDKLGVSGNIGYTTGNHLHFEIRDGNNKVVDPSKCLGL